jgi:LysM repeat protein
MVPAANTAGLFFKDSNIAKYYLVLDGKKHLISSPAAYRKLAAGKTKAYLADNNLLARIPTGSLAPSALPSALGSGANNGANTGATGGGTTGGGTASGSKTITYTVVSGDSLNKIAARFGTTLAKIVTDNKLKNPNSISVGLRLTIVIP